METARLIFLKMPLQAYSSALYCNKQSANKNYFSLVTKFFHVFVLKHSG